MSATDVQPGLPSPEAGGNPHPHQQQHYRPSVRSQTVDYAPRGSSAAPGAGAEGWEQHGPPSAYPPQHALPSLRHNASTPSLQRPPSDPPYVHPPQGDPTPNPNDLSFNQLRISDPSPASPAPDNTSVYSDPRWSGGPPHAQAFANAYAGDAVYDEYARGAAADDGRSIRSFEQGPPPPPPQGGGGYYDDQAAYYDPRYGPPPGQGWGPPHGYGAYPPPPPNPYYSAASDVLGTPYGVPPPLPPPPGPYGYAPYGASAPDLQRTNTTLTARSGTPSLARSGTSMTSMSARSAGAVPSSSKRKGNAATAPPRNEMPYNREFVDDYRARMKADPDPEAQFAFAKYLITAAKKIADDEAQTNPKGAHKYRDALLAEAVKLVKRLATQGRQPFAEAQFFLANCLGSGALGLQQDYQRAYELYLQAAKQNHPPSTYRAAVCNEVGAGTRKDLPRACELYRKAAALGDTAAMYKIGVILINGLLGVNKNPRDAVTWLKRAASQADEDNPHALHELGLLYERPVPGSVMQDDAHALDLFTQAAQLGYAQSQFKLGTAYEYGTLTCPVDPRRSIAWYTRAAEQGDPEAELALSGWYLTGSEGVLKQSDSEAYLWARKAANKGLAKAEYAVGYYSEVGIGVKQDIELAKRWYMRAAAQDNKRAMQRLTELKRLGNQRRNGGKRPTRQQAKDEGCIIC